MANWKFTERMMTDFKHELNTLLETRRTTMEQGFPLTVREVMASTMPVEALAAMEVLAQYKGSSLITTDQIYAIVPEVFGVERSCLLAMPVRQPQWYIWSEQRSNYEAIRAWLGRDKDHPRIFFHMDKLSVESREKFIKWLNAALMERRLCNATQKVALEFIEYHATSLAHVRARWPGLRIVFAQMSSPWPERMRDSSKITLSRWRWPTWGPEYEWRNANQKRMEGADIILAGAAALKKPDGSGNVAEVGGKIVQWDQKTDRDKN